MKTYGYAYVVIEERYKFNEYRQEWEKDAFIEIKHVFTSKLKANLCLELNNNSNDLSVRYKYIRRLLR